MRLAITLRYCACGLLSSLGWQTRSRLGQRGRLSPPAQLHFRLYGDRLGGLSEMPSSAARVRIAFSVRPRCNPITRVGVFPSASCLSCLTSLGVQDLPKFRVDLDMTLAPCPLMGALENVKAPLDVVLQNRLTAHAKRGSDLLS
jgi:hypothetical protein